MCKLRTVLPIFIKSNCYHSNTIAQSESNLPFFICTLSKLTTCLNQSEVPWDSSGWKTSSTLTYQCQQLISSGILTTLSQSIWQTQAVGLSGQPVLAGSMFFLSLSLFLRYSGFIFCCQTLRLTQVPPLHHHFVLRGDPTQPPSLTTLTKISSFRLVSNVKYFFSPITS